MHFVHALFPSKPIRNIQTPIKNPDNPAFLIVVVAFSAAGFKRQDLLCVLRLLSPEFDPST